jgi:hypothetical protein
MTKPVDKATTRWYTFLKEAKRFFANKKPGAYKKKMYKRALRRWSRKDLET